MNNNNNNYNNNNINNNNYNNNNNNNQVVDLTRNFDLSSRNFLSPCFFEHMFIVSNRTDSPELAFFLFLSFTDDGTLQQGSIKMG